MKSTTNDADVTIDRLLYASYAAQRDHAPDIAPHRWALIFDDWQAFEDEYQRRHAFEDEYQRRQAFEGEY